jgi:hypothetical protein
MQYCILKKCCSIRTSSYILKSKTPAAPTPRCTPRASDPKSGVSRYSYSHVSRPVRYTNTHTRRRDATRGFCVRAQCSPCSAGTRRGAAAHATPRPTQCSSRTGARTPRDCTPYASAATSSGPPSSPPSAPRPRPSHSTRSADRAGSPASRSRVARSTRCGATGARARHEQVLDITTLYCKRAKPLFRWGSCCCSAFGLWHTSAVSSRPALQSAFPALHCRAFVSSLWFLGSPQLWL